MPLLEITHKKRLKVLFFTLVFFFSALFVRMGYLQIFAAGDLQQKALDQWTNETPVKAIRGSILDRNGKVLAQSSTAYTVLLRPNRIKDVEKVVSELSYILNLDAETIRSKALDKKKSEIWLQRQITTEQRDAIKSLNMDGVDFALDAKRYYPQKNFLAQTLGYTKVDGEGQEGLEQVYDKYLKGQDGKVVTEVDRDGRELENGVRQYVAPQNGFSVELNIDMVIQYFVEKACDEALALNNAKSVQCIVMDPKTGAVLAMCTKPDFNLNEIPRDDLAQLQKLSRNSAITDAYEPGSTFKIITLAAALQEGKTDSGYFCKGSMEAGGISSKCWKTHGQLTLAEAVQNSCNVAFMTMGLKLGKEKLYQYVRDYGFGSKTGIDFSTDGAGILLSESIAKDFNIARMAYGQTVAVTPLQLITGVCATINGGNLMQPQLVKKVVDENGNVVEEMQPKVVRNVATDAVSQETRSLLESVVSLGSGRAAQIPGYKIGGKTGTAQKYENGQIATGKNVSSFIAFAPADDPQLAVLFVVDEPTGVSTTFGSVVAAPCVKNILDDTLRYLNIPPQFENEAEQRKAQNYVQVPDVKNMTRDEAVKKLQGVGLKVTDAPGSGRVEKQNPTAGARVREGSEVLLYFTSMNDESGTQ